MDLDSLGSAVSVTIRELVKEHTLKTLEECNGDKNEAALRLGISLKSLYNWLNGWGKPLKNYARSSELAKRWNEIPRPPDAESV